MNREEIIRMAWEAGFAIVDKHILADNENGPEHVICTEAINRFAALVAAAEREECAKVAGWLWQQFQDIKDAHERNSMEPFVPGQFGFDQSTVQQSKRMMDAIRARSST